jgi:hypothetical protein
VSEVTYLDPEQNNTNTNDKLDYKFILMRQIDKVRLSRSTEMRGGYWEKRPIAIAGGYTEQQFYVTDTRETYMSSVKSLRSLLIVYFDDKFTENYNSLLDDIDQLEAQSKDYEEKLIYIYDLILEELLMLCLRKKLIGGSQLLSDDIDDENFKENGENKS